MTKMDAGVSKDTCIIHQKRYLYHTLLSLRRLSKIFPSDVKRNSSAILYSKYSYPLSSATRNSRSPKSKYVEMGSTSTQSQNPTFQRKVE